MRTLPPGARVDWAELEARVLRHHPQVLAIAGVAQAWLLLRTVRGRSGGDGGSIGGGIAVLGALTAVGIAVVGERQDVPGWLHALLAWRMRSTSRRHRRRPPTRTPQPGGPARTPATTLRR